MCLLFVYINPHPTKDQFKLILVNNRDELYSRPTQNATQWEDGPKKIIAGIDLMTERKGGTWLGLSSTGRLASLLNIFQPAQEFKEAEAVEGRGFLVVDYLKGEQSGEEYMQALADSNVNYNKFNLVVMEPDMSSSTQGVPSDVSCSTRPYKLLYFNNNHNKVVNCGPGVHAFGNSFLCKPFRKVTKGKEKMQQIIQRIGVDTSNEEELLSSLFELMQDKEQMYPDNVLSSQGQGHPEEFIKNLSSIWLTIPSVKYGTRTTTIVLVDGSNRAVYRERTMKEPIDLNNIQWQHSNYTIQLDV